MGSDAVCEVRLQGVFVRPKHCTISLLEDSITVAAIGDAVVYINGIYLLLACTALVPGMQLQSGEAHPLGHGDRIIFGSHHYFRLNIPQEKRWCNTWKRLYFISILYLLIFFLLTQISPDDLHDFRQNSVVRDYTFAHEEFKRIQTERYNLHIIQHNTLHVFL